MKVELTFICMIVRKELQNYVRPHCLELAVTHTLYVQTRPTARQRHHTVNTTNSY